MKLVVSDRSENYPVYARRQPRTKFYVHRNLIIVWYNVVFLEIKCYTTFIFSHDLFVGGFIHFSLFIVVWHSDNCDRSITASTRWRERSFFSTGKCTYSCPPNPPTKICRLAGESSADKPASLDLVIPFLWWTYVVIKAMRTRKHWTCQERCVRRLITCKYSRYLKISQRLSNLHTARNQGQLSSNLWRND